MNHPNPPADARFASHLRSVRQAARLTQAQLAERMTSAGHRWMQTTVTKTESASRPLMLNEFVDLCVILGSEPADVLAELLGDRDDPGRAAERRLTVAQYRLEEARRQADLANFEVARAADEVAEAEADVRHGAIPGLLE